MNHPLITKTSIFYSICLSALCCYSSLAVDPHRVTGKWSDNEKPGYITIYKTSEGYEGKSVQLDEASGDIVREEITLTDLTYDEQTETFSGKLSPIGKDIELDVVMNILAPDTLSLTASKLFIKKTKTLYRKE